jgi:PIN domain nuclease of toxin-antitoxin system
MFLAPFPRRPNIIVLMFQGDPADRIIVATAIENGATLVTADEKILSWKPLKQKIDALL